MSLLNKAAGAVIAAGIATACLAQTPDSRIRLNTVGFLPDFPKKATVAVKAAQFSVVEPITGTALFTGALDSVYDSDTRESLWIADFSEVGNIGVFRLEVPGVGISPNFRISNLAFKETYRTMMLGMYLWRCGNPGGVDATFGGVRYNHGACHLSDGSLQYVGGGGTKDATGGWHDAGDYNKYVVNSGVTVGLMLKAWEHFHSALDTIDLSPVGRIGTMPAYLAEVKWNLDWVAKMQLSDNTVSHKMTTLNFGGNVMPQSENNTTRFFMPWSTEATGSFVGMMAQAYRLYKPYDSVFAESCLAKARRGYNRLMASDQVFADTVISKTGHYRNEDDTDQRLWAAAEMWESTGEERYLEYVEERLNNNHVRNVTEWANIQNLASLTYVLSRRAGRDPQKLAAMSERVITIANGVCNQVSLRGYGRPMTSYYWGTNGAVASTAFVLNAAYRITGDNKYRHASQDALSYLLGRNYFGRSFVTQVGHNPPKNPHCRRSIASGRTWPGYLIGGPHNGKPAEMQCAAAAICWDDDPEDYWANEIAINWNSAMIYALASVLPGAGTLPADPYPGQTIEVDPVSVRHATRRKTSPSSNVKITRVVQTQRGALDIPHGAKVYTLNGRLIAERKQGAPMPKIKRNGVYIIKVKE